MSEIGRMEVQLRLRPARIQRAADAAAESMIANLNRVMDGTVVTAEERERMAEAIRALARS